jgi:hypothetical protein
MGWVAVLYVCAAVNLMCDEHNSYDRLLFLTSYADQAACLADQGRQLAMMPQIDTGLRVTMSCQMRAALPHVVHHATGDALLSG